MKVIELNLSGCEYLEEIHERIRASFNFPKWYGKNWDAFWDLLWSECDADKVIIKGEQGLSNNLTDELTTLHRILDDKIEFNKKHQLSAFTYEIVN